MFDAVYWAAQTDASFLVLGERNHAHGLWASAKPRTAASSGWRLIQELPRWSALQFVEHVGLVYTVNDNSEQRDSYFIPWRDGALDPSATRMVASGLFGEAIHLSENGLIALVRPRDTQWQIEVQNIDGEIIHKITLKRKIGTMARPYLSPMGLSTAVRVTDGSGRSSLVLILGCHSKIIELPIRQISDLQWESEESLICIAQVDPAKGASLVRISLPSLRLTELRKCRAGASLVRNHGSVSLVSSQAGRNHRMEDVAGDAHFSFEATAVLPNKAVGTSRYSLLVLDRKGQSITIAALQILNSDASCRVDRQVLCDSRTPISSMRVPLQGNALSESVVDIKGVDLKRASSLVFSVHPGNSALLMDPLYRSIENVSTIHNIAWCFIRSPLLTHLPSDRIPQALTDFVFVAQQIQRCAPSTSGMPIFEGYSASSIQAVAGATSLGGHAFLRAPAVQTLKVLDSAHLSVLKAQRQDRSSRRAPGSRTSSLQLKILHGAQDRRVNISSSKTLTKKWRTLGIGSAELCALPHYGHDLLSDSEIVTTSLLHLTDLLANRHREGRTSPRERSEI